MPSLYVACANCGRLLEMSQIGGYHYIEMLCGTPPAICEKCLYKYTKWWIRHIQPQEETSNA